MRGLIIFIVFISAIQIQAQNVGIGLTNPQAKLTVFDPILSGTLYQTEGTTAEDGFFIGMQSSKQARIMNFENAGLSLGTFNTDHLTITSTGNIGVGTTSPDASAVLDVSSMNKGLLPPRMNKVQRDAITAPAEGLMISCTDCTVKGLHQYINGNWQAMMTSTTGNYGTVVNPVTGKVWLDRNLGATQVATSSTDVASYGDLYQWGRNADGHQLRSSGTTTSQVSHFFTSNSMFIISTNWLSGSTPPTHMWSGTAAENNPCPCGFRIPTAAEWEQERRTWISNNAAGAFASPLKLPMGGRRTYSDGSLIFVGSLGYYSSSTISGSDSYIIFLNSSNSDIVADFRSTGSSVRCIKD